LEAADSKRAMASGGRDEAAFAAVQGHREAEAAAA